MRSTREMTLLHNEMARRLERTARLCLLPVAAGLLILAGGMFVMARQARDTHSLGGESAGVAIGLLALAQGASIVRLRSEIQSGKREFRYSQLPVESA